LGVIVTHTARLADGPIALVVDDDAVTRTLVSEALAQEGFTVVPADDGETALALFETHRPDIVLMDALMPGMDGFEACRAIRTLPGATDVPVLMLTALDDVRSVALAYEAGATDFATKPIPWQVLVHRARYMLRAKEVLSELRRSQTRLASAQRLARLGHWERDLETGETHWSRELSEILGLAPEPVADPDALLARVHPDDREAVEAARQELASAKTYRVDFRVLRPDGSVRFMHEQAEVVSNDQGQPLRAIGTIQDITERREAEERARFLAHYDELTGLPNRRLLVEHLRLALARARRSNRLVATLFVDLDRFKRINDTLGHAMGDRVLQVVADRLRACVRESDVLGRPESPDGQHAKHAVGRFGGDEFILVLADLHRGIDADTVARRILRALEEPLAIEGHEIAVTASIGIGLFPSDGRDEETLLRNADSAMYHAKQQGRNRQQFYDPSMNAQAAERFALEDDLRRAVSEGQFVLYFQPQVDSRSGLVVGAEALIRWQHPARGLVAPATFIPVAEETGLIVPIGQWVMRRACEEARTWRDAGHGLLPVSVNLSGRQFTQDDLAQTITRCVSSAGLSPAQLEIELTESVLMGSSGHHIDTLRALRATGIRIAVDDFGIGYSSLSYLKQLPVDRIKIDRSFVRDVLTNPDDAALSEAIIAIASALRLGTIAEGIETQPQAEFFRDRGCHCVQGLLFGGPVSADDFARLLREGRTFRAPGALLPG
jgi:PAS domain S-box-containing protein